MMQTITRRRFLKALGGLAALSATRAAVAARGRGPNIILIMADDLGYGDLGCYGSTSVKTPVIDGLAARGVRFTQFYSNGPECSPTRTALLTGRYQHRVGGLECAIGIGNVGRYDDAIRLAETHDLGLPASETSIARMLKTRGYATAICGKWHLGYEEKFLPRHHGFDHFFGPLGGAVDYFHHIEYTGQNVLYLNDKPVKRDGYLTDLITDDAVDFIRRTRNEPFFLYVPYTAPHTPYQGPDDRNTEPIPEQDYNTPVPGAYTAMVEAMDRGVGRILNTLKDLQLSDETLVVFMSDNGANSNGDNGPYSGYKGNVFEGGIRVPCIAVWPGRIAPATTCDQACMTLDFSRSIVRAAGAEPPTNRRFDGVDILDHVEKQSPTRPRMLFWRARRGQDTRKAVRSGALKYIRLQNGDDVSEYVFDLKSDPAEKHNLIDTDPETTRKLKALLADWEQRVAHQR